MLPTILIIMSWAARSTAQGTPASLYTLVSTTKYNSVASNYGGPADGGVGAAVFGLTVGGCGYGDISSANVYPRRAAFAFDPLSPIAKDYPSLACGTCWKVTNPSNDYAAFVAMVTDTCPGCNSVRKNDYAIDVDWITWKSVVPASMASTLGTFDAILEQVNCQPEGNLRLTITDFTGGWNWIRLLPTNVAGIGSVKSITMTCPSVQMSSSTVSVLDNTWGTVYESKTTKVPLYRPGTPCTFTVVSAADQTLVSAPLVMDQYVGKGGVVDMGANFAPVEASSAGAPPGKVGISGRKLGEQGPRLLARMNNGKAFVTEVLEG